jgi:Flp pilus assembly pilin Flp
LTRFPDKGDYDQHRGKQALYSTSPGRAFVSNYIRNLWSEEAGQDIAEYAVMVAVILIIVVGTIRLIGSNSNTVFSNVASSVQ